MSEAERLRHEAWNAVLALDHAAAISGSENSGHFAAQADALRVALRQQTEEPAQPEPAKVETPSDDEPPKGMPGICYSIDGDSWHRPGTCPHCRKPAQSDPTAKVNGNTPVGEYDPDMKPADPGAGR
jgi:hypothetical protein